MNIHQKTITAVTAMSVVATATTLEIFSKNLLTVIYFFFSKERESGNKAQML